MPSILDIEVSCFRSYFSKEPRNVNLLTWLTSDKYALQVAEIRQLGDKDARDTLKRKLPAITPAGIFSKKGVGGLKRHSGFIVVEIDFKDNTQIGNYKDLKAEISKIEQVAYCGLSVSGTGYFVLIPIAYPDKHLEHFLFIEKFFKKYNITIDPSGKDVSRLRGYSHDPEAYFNHNAKILTSYLPPNRNTVPLSNAKTSWASQNESSNRLKVEQYLELASNQRVDLTEGYKNWLSIGFAFASEFGEGGRSYYHQVSSLSIKYNRSECDRQYENCLRSQYTGTPITIRTFFKICKDMGLSLPNLNISQNRVGTPLGSPLSNGDRFEKLKDGTRIKITAEGYPEIWDTFKQSPTDFHL